jgi:hypothetical protein
MNTRPNLAFITSRVFKDLKAVEDFSRDCTDQEAEIAERIFSKVPELVQIAEMFFDERVGKHEETFQFIFVSGLLNSFAPARYRNGNKELVDKIRSLLQEVPNGLELNITDPAFRNAIIALARGYHPAKLAAELCELIRKQSNVLAEQIKNGPPPVYVVPAVLPKGFPTHTKDITGETIKLGDMVDYDFEGDDPCPFEVVFEENAFRKKYPKWDEANPKPLLENQHQAENMRLKIVKLK